MDDEPRWVVMRSWAVGVMHESVMQHATRNVRVPQTHGPYHVSTARRIWRERADRAQIICHGNGQRQQPIAKRTRRAFTPLMPVTSTTMVACPRCGHQYCNQPSKQEDELTGDEWFIVCGMESAGTDRRHCCACADEAAAWAAGRIRIPSPPMDVRTESPVTTTNLMINPQPQEAF